MSKVNKFITLCELLTSSESSDDELEWHIANKTKRVIPKIQNFVTNVVDTYTDNEFKNNFRLSRNTCNNLIELYENYIQRVRRNDSVNSPKEEILVFLWFAANKTVLRSVGLLFDMSLSTVHSLIQKVSDFLLDLALTVIRFPDTEDERREKANDFLNICQIDGIIGSIDGTYIPIRTPRNKIRHTYVNRHDETAITLQGICDANKKFIDCFTGISSKMHDARVYQQSFIREKIVRLPNLYHVIGDAAYPISTNLLTPYRGDLNETQANFNQQFCRARVYIENTFGLLKNRFRQLMRLDMWEILSMSKFVICCCVLHNLCTNPEDDLQYRNFEYINQEPEECVERANRVRMLGQMKRNTIAVNLMNI